MSFCREFAQKPPGRRRLDPRKRGIEAPFRREIQDHAIASEITNYLKTNADRTTQWNSRRLSDVGSPLSLRLMVG